MGPTFRPGKKTQTMVRVNCQTGDGGGSWVGETRPGHMCFLKGSSYGQQSLQLGSEKAQWGFSVQARSTGDMRSLSRPKQSAGFKLCRVWSSEEAPFNMASAGACVDVQTDSPSRLVAHIRVNGVNECSVRPGLSSECGNGQNEPSCCRKSP